MFFFIVDISFNDHRQRTSQRKNSGGDVLEQSMDQAGLINGPESPNECVCTPNTL